MNIQLTAEIYKNLIKMCAYRNLTIVGDILSEDKLIQTINFNEYISIEATRSKLNQLSSAYVFIILLKENARYMSKTALFKRLVEDIIKKNISGDPTEITFIMDEPLSSNINKMLAEFKQTVFIESYNYALFRIELPLHESVPKHSILPEDELITLLELYKTHKERFPIIKASDPQAVWLGARPGQVIKILRPSDSAGYAIAYRICV